MAPRRGLTPAFVLTAVAAASCTPRSRKALPVTTSPEHVQVLDFTALEPLNPRDHEGRMIYARGTACVVRVPFDRPPKSWQPPKTKVVDCPPSMDDPAWDQCSGALHRRKDASACVCMTDGNPPPPPTKVPCPASP